MAGQYESIMASKRWVIIGDASLTLECIKHLYRNACSLLVISTNSLIKNWCCRYNIQIFENIAQYESFDFANKAETILLSIVNYQVLSEKFINRFCFAVNYHDSLLPKYAGLYATTWAILNDEKTHGISWHIIKQEIDAGKIILTRKFRVDQEETAYSLNLKCTNEALQSFPSLLEKIENHNITEKKQDLSNRTYYSKDCILAAHALISFDDNVSYINKILRAFNFSKEFFNPLSIPKICINQQSFLLSDIEINNKLHNLSCGTIIEKNEKHIEIAVIEGSITIKKIMTAYGKNLTISEFLVQSNLVTYHCMNSFSKLKYRCAKKSESFWLQELTNFKYLDKGIIEFCKQYHCHTRYQLNEITIRKLLEKLNKLTDLKKYSVLYSNENLLKLSEANFELYSSFVPIKISNGQNSLSPASNSPLLADLFVRSHFNKNQFPLLIISENVSILKKIPFFSFVLIIKNKDKIDIIEHNAKFNVDFDLSKKPKIRKISDIHSSICDFINLKNTNKTRNCILEEETWYSFDTILKKANQFSHYLIAQGIKKNDIVGLGIPSGINYFISLLGVAQIGASYVPLDPDYPSERLLYIVKDTRLKHIITTQKYFKKFCFSTVTTTMLETIQPILNELLETSLSMQFSLDIPIYVIYTSGTTGVPKGVVVSHSNVINCLIGTLRLLDLNDKRFLAVTSTSFDIHLLDYLLPLCSKGEVVIAPQEFVRNGKLLCQFIQQHNIKVMQATPMTWRMLIESGWVGSKDFLIICCGEPLTPDLAEQLLQRGILYNLYGPTEATIYAAGTLINNSNDITIGTEIGDTELFILDEYNQPVPEGEQGQIAIAGKGVAIKYLNQSQLTNEKFIAHPFKTGQRIYLTGDIGKRLQNGNVYYSGRKDDQVKINGIRIELKEIEEVLKQATSIKNIIVLLNSKNHNSKKIIVYIEKLKLTTSQSSLIVQLKKYAEKKLPKFMLPHQYIFVEKFPLMLSGKVDRELLSKIQANEPIVENYQSDVEKSISDIWKNLLNVANIQPSDDFFSLGGNSLLAIKLASLLASNWEIDIEYSDIIDLTTIQQQASFIESSLLNIHRQM